MRLRRRSSNARWASTDQTNWIQAAYLIAKVIAIPLTGFLTRWLGMRGLLAVAVTLPTAVLATTIGPVVGGWITDTCSWRWLFLGEGVLKHIGVTNPRVTGRDVLTSD